MSNKSYLDEDGLLYVWNKCKGKFAEKGDIPTGTVTSITMNESSYTPTSGVVNLGTVITQHQDISGKANVADTVTAVSYASGNLKYTKNGADTTVVAADSIMADMSGASQSAKGLMSSADKTKLDGFSAASNYALKTDITGIYKYKGSVATESLLPSSGVSTGDVYDIVAESSYGAPGTNVAWTGSAWDALGGLFSISSITNAEIDEICV